MFHGGARSNFAHSSSNLPGFGLAALVICLLVDSSVYANCVFCITAAFLPTKQESIVSENSAILLSFVSEARSLGVCTTESAPSNILMIKVIRVYLQAASCNRSSLSSLLSRCGTRPLNEKFLLPRHSFYRRASNSRVLRTPQCALCPLHPSSHGNCHQSFFLLSSLALISSRTANPNSSSHVTHVLLAPTECAPVHC